MEFNTNCYARVTPAGVVLPVADGKTTVDVEVEGCTLSTAVTVEGAADDPEWGKWTIAGDRLSADAAFKVTLHSDDVHLTPEKLAQIQKLLKRAGEVPDGND